MIPAVLRPIHESQVTSQWLHESYCCPLLCLQIQTFLFLISVLCFFALPLYGGWASKLHLVDAYKEGFRKRGKDRNTVPAGR